MVDILNLEKNPIYCILSNRKLISLLPGATTGFNMATKHEIEGNALRAHLRQEVELAHGYYLRVSINLMKQINKQIKKQIQ